MSNDPSGQSVQSNSSDNTYSYTPMQTVVGQVKVADKSYGIGGQVVDSTGDTPIDVNALVGVEAPPNLVTPSTGYGIKLEESGKGGPSEPVNKNPEQTFLPHDTQEN